MNPARPDVPGRRPRPPGPVDPYELAPAAFDAWAALAAWVDPAVTARVEGVLGCGPALPADDPVAVFTDQVVLDVSGVSAGMRRDALGMLGAGAFGHLQQVFVADYGLRLRLACVSLFGVGPRGSATSGDLWGGLEAFLRAVARLDRLDPVTTELVRLRGARQHSCRVCQSRRSAPAVRAGADEAVFARVDDYPASDLPARQKAALRLTDALLWHPRDVPAEIVDLLGPAETVEVVLDVVRNATNKIAVALGADAATVGEGVELFDVTAEGELRYGVAL